MRHCGYVCGSKSEVKIKILSDGGRRVCVCLCVCGCVEGDSMDVLSELKTELAIWRRADNFS